MIPVLIPAAGASRRMRGTDKLLQKVDGIPLLRRQVAIACAVSDDVRIGLPPAPHPRYDVLAGMPVRTVEVANAAEGMGATLRTLFNTLTQEPRAMVLLADLPALTEEDLRTVLSAQRDAPGALIWRGATADGRGGHPMVVDASLFDAFRALKGDDGGRAIIKKAAARVHLVPLDGNRARLDLDTPEAWADWRAGHPTSTD